jgi:hypothetical protein
MRGGPRLAFNSPGPTVRIDKAALMLAPGIARNYYEIRMTLHGERRCMAKLICEYARRTALGLGR